MPNKCPYCDYVTPAEEPGTAQTWQEIAHMQTNHPGIISDRLHEAGILDADSGFGRGRVTTTINIPGDMSVEDLRLLVQIVADANKAAGLRDKRIQRIETTLDSTLMQMERTT